MHIHRRRGWETSERDVTPESVYLSRRVFLKRMALAGTAVAAGLVTAGPRSARAEAPTPETQALEHARYAEFGGRIERGDAFTLRPWRIRIDGLVERPREIDLDDLVRRAPIEQRVYRHRCASGWSMTVPWTGFPLASLVRWAAPLASARYLRVVSFLRPDEAPGQQRPGFRPWPSTEGISIAEAMHELAFVAVGSYGHELPVAHGAPLRLVMPWKYGHKSLKAIQRFEFVDRRPRSSWEAIDPRQYEFASNVMPSAAQPMEWVLGAGVWRPTRAYNGYADTVAGLYA